MSTDHLYTYSSWSPSQPSKIQESSGTICISFTNQPILFLPLLKLIQIMGLTGICHHELDNLTGGQADKQQDKVRLPLFFWLYIYTRINFSSSFSCLDCFFTKDHFKKKEKKKKTDSSGILQRYAVRCTVVTLPCHRAEECPPCQLNGFEACALHIFPYKYLWDDW